MSTRKLLICCALVSCVSCGRPPLLTGDGAPPDPGVLPDAGVLFDAGAADACVRPRDGCFSDEECDEGWACQGCEPDPCCPLCDVCYGRCVPLPRDLSCESNADCREGEYCRFGEGCGAAGPGTCVGREPTWCNGVGPGVCETVCGCDGVDYCTPCNAAHAGVSVASYGPCP